MTSSDACANGQKDPEESDVDCGGPCGPCGSGAACAVDQDCTSGLCSPGLLCAVASCTDGVQSGEETGVDCGGPCPLCPGDDCSQDGQCTTGFCKTGICDTPSCNDGIKNGDETGADCGGGDCPLCELGQGCSSDASCLSGFCTSDGTCAEPACDDGVSNGDEHETDCGGPTCLPCDPAEPEEPTCDDGQLNGDEIEVDCGGADCEPCPQEPTCDDGQLNGDETGLDCGGDDCDPCPEEPSAVEDFGQSCASNDDCDSGFCVLSADWKVCSKTCGTGCPTGWECKTVEDAASGMAISLCVSSFVYLCMPCHAHADCAPLIGGAGACISHGAQGSFCGGACDGDGDCPSGFLCEEVSELGSKQCVPASGSCTCSELAIKLGAFTSCHEANEHGTCYGTRSCAPEGLTDCDALTPHAAPEPCSDADGN